MTLPKPVRVGLQVALALMVFATGYITAWSLHKRHRLRALRAGLIAQGEKLTVNELLDPLSVTDYEAGANLARLLGQSVPDFIAPSAMRFIAPGKAMAGVGRPLMGEPGFETNTWQEATVRLAGFQPFMRSTEEMLRRDQLAVRLDYTQSLNLPLPHLPPCKQLARLFATTSMHDLHAGNLASATQNIVTALRIPNALRHDHLIISELVRIAIANITGGVIWEALQRDGWRDPQLSEIQHACAENDFAEQMIHSLELERAMMGETFTRMRHSNIAARQILDEMPRNTLGPVGSPTHLGFNTLRDVLEFTPAGLKGRWLAFTLATRILAWRWFFSYDDEYHYLRLTQELLAGCRAGRDQHSWVASQGEPGDNTAAPLPALVAATPRWCILTKETVPSISTILLHAATAETWRELTSAALALKRFQLRSGHFPERLDQLVPDFLTAVPRDWMDGGQLRYHAEGADSFRLYSVGENGRDDGGNPEPATKPARARNFKDGLDFVWPKAATEAEIEASVAREKKRR